MKIALIVCVIVGIIDKRQRYYIKSRVKCRADQIGMLATVMNCIYVSEIFRSVGIKTNVLTPFECGSMTKLFSKDRANKYFEKGMVVFFAGGTGHPGRWAWAGVHSCRIPALYGGPL